MTTFDIITPDMSTPWFVPLLVAVGFLLFAALSIVASVRFYTHVEKDGTGNVLFGMLAFITIVVAVVVPAAVFSGIDSSTRDGLVIAALEERGYDNIDLSMSQGFFTGSDEDGLFVYADILEKSPTEYVVVVRSE